MKQTYLALVIAGLLHSLPVMAAPSSHEAYPSAFSDFFEEQSQRIDVEVAGAASSVNVASSVTYETYRIDAGASVTALSEYLRQQHLSPVAVSAIIATLQQGIQANPHCQGELALCVPTVKTGHAEYVYDFDNSKLRIFVSPEMLTNKTGKVDYYPEKRENNALINYSDAYVYTDSDNNSNVNWTNNAVLGLPYGYLSVDSQYVSEDSDLHIYRAAYDLDVQNKHVVIGYQDRNTRSLNSTDFLSYGANYAGVRATVGSSQNLVKGNHKALQRIHFFAPQDAQLEVYQGDRLLLDKIVAQGEQSIGYDALPSGIYTITLVLKQGKNEILREQRQVVNTDQFSINVGDWDYRLESGVLDNIDNTDIDERHHLTITDSDRTYVRGAASYRFSENTLLGIGATSNTDDSELQLGTAWIIGGKVNVSYTGALFNTGERYQNGVIGIGPLSTSYRTVSLDNTPHPLSRLLFGDQDYTEWSVNYTTALLGGNAFVSYFNYVTDDKDNNNEASSHNLSLSWSRNLPVGTLSINSTYSEYNDQHNAVNTTVAWRYDFNDSFSTLTAMAFNDTDMAYSEQSATYSHIDDNNILSATAGVKLGQQAERESDLSVTASGSTDRFNYSGYGYIDSRGERSLSGNISSTQVLSSEGGMITSEQGQSFVGIAPTLKGNPSRTVPVHYGLSKNGEYRYEDNVETNSTTLLNIDPYTDININLDAESENVLVDNTPYQHFMMPGMYHSVNTEVTPLQSHVFVLNNLYGQPITGSVHCLGDGCQSVEQLSDDGVYRVNYAKEATFKLITQKNVCVYSPLESLKTYSQAYCLPGLNDEEENIPWDQQQQLKEEDNTLLYVGKFTDLEDGKKVVTRLKHVGLDVTSVDIGDSEYIYVRLQEKYTIAQQSVLDNLHSFVVVDSAQSAAPTV
ncbi:hypothetical protein SKA34_08388 [Photobacterium sp. SKA34]|uniref:TcfC E-set like domain-containing protein n=1 Tax=Photobacterium sp. SKA34 TaxID=121723 RepID=UPI00006B40E2|nr:TcfC E-set like domain-containing protein [Photobacterium sp. SKA34]EAR57590.1 hypothetical protein SKA34_08388 [Photobacterium sp. SKA34]